MGALGMTTSKARWSPTSSKGNTTGDAVLYNASMRKPTSLLRLLVLITLAVAASSANDQFTPLVASALTATTTPFLGTDGQQHLVYELVITNTNPTPATLQKVTVLDGSDPTRVIATFEANDLLSRLRTTGGGEVESPTLELDSTRLLLIDISLAPTATLPSRLVHRIELRGAPSPARQPTTPVALSYAVAPIEISRKLRVIGPPLAGKHWVVTNGCCAPGGAHRATSLAVNGGIFFAQRFAIDWMRLDDAGRFVMGDPSDVHNYTSYGADLLAVADGTVVDTLNNLDDQKPGTLPDPKTITIENVDGNHVVLDLGDGVFAFYAHMIKGSVVVHQGDHVTRGQVLGKLGNTGNTSAPHLHFHLMDGPSVLGSQGIPYEIDAFQLAGEVNKAQFDAAPGVEGEWSKGLLPTPSPRQKQFPLDLNVVNF